MGALTIIADVLEIVVLIGAAIHLFSHAGESGRRSPAVMLGFAFTVIAVSNLYWIAHEIMTREAIFEFSAIDVASAGFYILFGASLAMVIGRHDKIDVRAFIFAGAAAVAQSAMWIVWAGSWFKNALGGLPVWYATYYVILASWDTRAMSNAKRAIVVLCAAAVTLIQVGGATLPIFARFIPLLDIIDGPICLMAAAVIDLTLLGSWRAENSLEKTVALAFLGVLWTWSAMFLMYEPFYSIFHIISIAQMALAALAVTRWVEQQ